MNKEKPLTQYRPGELMYLMSPHASLLKTSSRKFRVIYVALIVICEK